jgi:Calcineurin-like phosphoesterase
MRTTVLLAIVQVVALGNLDGQILSPAWVELGEGGRAIARMVVNGAADCPNAEVDGTSLAMTPREPVPDGFRLVCEAQLPAGARSAQVKGQALALPHPDPSRIVVIGDTGCRIKGTEVQDCGRGWPFERVAKAAASTRPQLVIHVGDYLYREDPCPAKDRNKCGGSPFGDNWEAWNADFFRPAASLLTAAPWAFSRGNHEDCNRAWRGWFYYLDPRPWQGGPCVAMPPPYSIQLGMFQLIEFDSSAADQEQGAPEQVRNYAAQLASLHAQNAWLVDHHPFWALRLATATFPAVAETDVLQQAWNQASPQGIAMVLSGHTHLFELLSYGPERPLQIVAGDAGTKLDKAARGQINGARIYGLMVQDSDDEEQFGYTLLNKSDLGWTLSLRNPKSKEMLNCDIQGRSARCKSGR